MKPTKVILRQKSKRYFSTTSAVRPGDKELETDVCIIGSGPVGMVLSRMLTKFKVKNIVLE